MTTVEGNRQADEALSHRERVAWERLVTRHHEELRAEMYRALFDDVRPAWEEYFANQGNLGSKAGPTLPASSADMIAGMSSALFDDVRPAWEAHTKRQERSAN